MRRNSKKGVSLVMLILTIIIMLILTGVVIHYYTSTNIKKNAKEATFKENYLIYREELRVYLVRLQLQNEFFDPNSVNCSWEQMLIPIPSMRDEDMYIYDIINGKLVLKSTATEYEKQWARELGMDIAGENFDPNATSSDDGLDVVLVPSVAPASGSPIHTLPMVSAPATTAPAPSGAAPSATLGTGRIGSLTLPQIRSAIAADTSPGYTVSGYATVSTGKRFAQQLYGKPVNYNGNGITDWKIYYVDNSNIYLITSYFVPYSYLPGSGMTKGANNYKVQFNTSTSMHTTIADTNKMVTRGYMSLSDMYTFGMNTTPSGGNYQGRSGATLQDNFKCALFLLNENKWSSFVNSAQKGEAAYGGPTARMVILSTNEYWKTNVAISAATTNGYKFNGEYNCKWPVEENNVYTITGASSDASSYWVAGPSANNYISVLHCMYSGYFTSSSYDHTIVRNSCSSITKNRRNTNMEFNYRQI